MANRSVLRRRAWSRLAYAAVAAGLLLGGEVAAAPPELPAKFLRSPYALMALSVGAPNDGRVVRPGQLRESKVLKIKAGSHERSYGHPALVLMLKRSAKDISRAAPASVMLVGDLSASADGPISGHRSHQSGRDADVGFYLRDARGRQVLPEHFVKIDQDGRAVGDSSVHFDDERNWQLVRSWLRDRRAGISHVFVATHVRERLLKYARSSKARQPYVDAAAALLHQPSKAAIHDDHFHVRITCPQGQAAICVGPALSD